MTGPEVIRAHGCNLRATIINAHSNFGDTVGLQVLERMAFEVAENGAEIHGPSRMAEVLYKAADRMIANAGPPVFPAAEPYTIDLVSPDDVDGEEKVTTEPDPALTSSRGAAKWPNRIAMFAAGVGALWIATGRAR